MKLAINNSDSIGALASSLCLVHCVATPFIFVVQSCAASCCASAPAWWSLESVWLAGVVVGCCLCLMRCLAN